MPKVDLPTKTFTLVKTTAKPYRPYYSFTVRGDGFVQVKYVNRNDPRLSMEAIVDVEEARKTWRYLTTKAGYEQF